MNRSDFIKLTEEQLFKRINNLEEVNRQKQALIEQLGGEKSDLEFYITSLPGSKDIDKIFGKQLANNSTRGV